MNETILKTILAAISAGVALIFGGWDVSLQTLFIFIGLDIVSGFARAAIQGALSSKESFKGMGKKFLILVVVAVAVQLDKMAGTGETLRSATVLFYCMSEGLSIVENLVAAGVPVPEALKNALAQLNPSKAGAESKVTTSGVKE